MRNKLYFLQLCLLAVLCVSAPLREIRAQSLPPQTEAKLQAIINSPSLREAHVGLSVLDLGTVKDAKDFPAKPPIGKPFRVLFEHDAQKKFMPASNMKLFTAAIALELLGKEKTFPTRVYGRGIDAQSLKIVGGGDPSLSYSDLLKLAHQIRPRITHGMFGVRVFGRAYTGETAGGRYPFGWTLDDTRWYYGPEISALAIERNELDIVVTGASVLHERADVKIERAELNAGIRISNNVRTALPTAANVPEENLLDFHWSSNYADGRAVLQINGQVGQKRTVKLGLAGQNPEDRAAHLFRHALMASGTRHDFEFYDRGHPSRGVYASVANMELWGEHNSAPLQLLFHRLLKNSDNLYAEMLLRNASYYHDGTGGNKAGPRAHALLKEWLIKQGIDTTPLRFEDGSGLSRYNLLTPRATAELLAAINKMKDGDVIWDALPIAGTDGTLRNRIKSTPAAGNVRAKTGTFSIASNLSGYVTTRDNRRLAVALYINFPRDSQSAKAAQDQVFAVLADMRLQ